MIGEVFRKTGSRAGVATEVASLAWLAEAEVEGGAAVAEVVDVGEQHLSTRMLVPTAPSATQAAEFGRRLARTHASGAGWWGEPPPGLDVADARLAELPAHAVAEPRYATWGEFYADTRLAPYVRIAADNGNLARAQTSTVERAIEVIAAGTHDAPQPALVARDGVARIHGDLWGGNVVWAATGDEVVGTLIDPSAHGGHAETDLAELALFGSPHLAETLAGYREVSPLADGWRDRVELHQFHMLLVHVALFGGGYVRQAIDVAARLT